MSAPFATELEPRPAAAIASYFVVLNPGSGKQQDSLARRQIEEVLGAAGRHVEFILLESGRVTAACQEAARRAAQAGGALVAVGGDGTLNAVAQAALLHRCPMGVIAQGTFNFFARDHALPQDAAEGARALLAARVQPVQVGLLNERVFLVNGSIGLYPQLLQDRETFKQKLGRRRWVAMLAGLKTVLSWRHELEIELELDGEITRLRTPTLFVGNNRLQLERAGVAPELAQQVGTGRLVAMIARPQGPGAKLRWMLRAFMGRLGESPEIDTFALRSLTVAAGRRRRVKTATDGEAMSMTPPLRFAVSPTPLLLLKPDDTGVPRE